MTANIQREVLNSLEDSQQVLAYLDSSEVELFDSKKIDLLYKVLRRYADDSDFTVAYGGNYTIEPLNRYVGAYAARFGVLTNEYVMPFNQYMQELMSPGSGLHKAAPHLIVYSLAMEAMTPGFFSPGFDWEAAVEKIAEDIEMLVEKTLESTRAGVVVSDFPNPYDDNEVAGERCHRLNNRIQAIADRSSRLQLIMQSGLVRSIGWRRAHDARMYAVAKMMWTHQMNSLFAMEIVKCIYAVSGFTKKCLVLDLDNTLWGGIVGEDGPEGIRVGKGSKTGKEYETFQRSAAALKNDGVVLALCSKNNRPDVEEVFRLHPEMPLQLDDFVATKINWNRKSENIREIASELNIGLNSLVFIDDNPVEIDEVKTLLPEVATLLVPAETQELPQLLDRVPYFAKGAVTEEDRNKTRLYQENKKREELKSSAGTLKDYLRGLNTEVLIRRAEDRDIERVRQLFVKTNQFNLTTIRYDHEAVEFFLNSEACDLILIEVRDRYGELGITGLCLIAYEDPKARIDSFILSCRVLGRNVESVFLDVIKKLCSGREQVRTITAAYIPTAKNIQTENFYEREGFNCIESTEEGKKYYELPVEKITYASHDHIAVKESVI